MTGKPFANFDYASGMIKALANALRDKEFPAAGMGTKVRLLAPLVGKLPQRAREHAYALGGALQAVSQRRIGSVNAQKLAEWTVDQYPNQRYPCVFIGSSNGAMMHLCGALGAPWLPQTTLIPMRQSHGSPDDAQRGMDDAREAARALLDNNPELQLHHVHDPNQDRRMLAWMAYFRVKWRTLADAYRRFLDRQLAEGGTIVLVECNRRWRVTEVDERHYFQFGAEGGIEAEEYFRGSARVADYLARNDVGISKWSPPEPTTTAPEAEWGFEPALRAEVEAYAARRGARVVRLGFDQPQSLSPLVAEFFRHWYRQRGIEPDRLLADCFLLTDPHLTRRTGSVPFWLVFPTEPSARSLEAYQDNAADYREILIGLFSHSTQGAGLAPIERWRALLGRARQRGDFVGMDESRYPLDFAAFSGFHAALKRMPQHYPTDVRATLDEFLAFAMQSPFAKGASGRFDGTSDGGSDFLHVTDPFVARRAPSGSAA